MAGNAQGFWPNLQQQMMDDPAAFSAIELDCVICFEPLKRHPDTERHEVGQPHRDHRGSILPCGHFFGDRCLYDFQKTKFNEFGEPPACPTCNSQQPRHPGCNHLVNDRDLPSTVKEAECLPQILTRGGTLSEKCSWCQLIDSTNEIMDHIEETGPTPEFWPAVTTSVSFADYFFNRCKTHAYGDHEMRVFLNHIHLEGELLAFIRGVERQLARSSATHWQSLDLHQVTFHLHRMNRVRKLIPEEHLEGSFILALLASD
ncbi:hypothetical protein FALBO_2275 [Fusarium albosuccineum]|uniref:RING-type domain-containing protein n=1 Tax=Fusarium albosuccineum TaxID=1237068 RepID=A0A8H4LJN4_9HYPO|nr:hypothetical protein FALBO_2275 [Fusarium albosuccineum]